MCWNKESQFLQRQNNISPKPSDENAECCLLCKAQLRNARVSFEVTADQWKTEVKWVVGKGKLSAVVCSNHVHPSASFTPSSWDSTQWMSCGWLNDSWVSMLIRNYSLSNLEMSFFWSFVASVFASCSNSTIIALPSSVYTHLVWFSCAVSGITFLSGEVGGSSFCFGSRSFLMSVKDRVTCCPWDPAMHCVLHCESPQIQVSFRRNDCGSGQNRSMTDINESCVWVELMGNSSAIAHITHPPSFCHFLLLSRQIHCSICPWTWHFQWTWY